MVLFLCRNESSRNGMELCEDFLYQIRKFLASGGSGGGHLGGHNPPGCASPPPPQAHPGGCCPPRGLADPQTDAIKSHIFTKKIKEKELSRFMRRSCRRLLFFIGRPDLESVWGSGEGDLRSSSSPTHLHRQFHDAPHRE